MGLRPYQKDLLTNSLIRYQQGVYKQIAVLPVGAGKTPCFCNMRSHHGITKKALVIVHRDELASQAFEKMEAWNPGLSIGVEMGVRVAALDNDVVVAGIQTLAVSPKRLKKLNPEEYGLIIVDECHLSVAASYQKVFEHFGLLEGNPHKVLLCGFTATTTRGDGRALGEVYDEVVYDYSMQQAILDGWLSPIHGVTLQTSTDISKVSANKEDFNETQLGKAVNTPERNELIVKFWIESCWPRQTIVFASGVEHAKDMCSAFVRNGVRAAYIFSEDSERKSKIKQFTTGELDVILNVAILDTGFDYHNVECVILASPSKSQTNTIQKVGRGSRLPNGVENFVVWQQRGWITPEMKQNCLVVDVCDVLGKHSLATLPSLFGLSPDLNLRGRNIMVVLGEIKEQQELFPNVDMGRLRDVNNLKTYVREANLWQVKFASETKEYSKLQWSKRGDGSYRLLLPKEAISIREDMVGRYTVEGSVNGNPIKQSGLPDLGAAVGLAEMHISLFGKDIIKLLRNDARWRKEDISLKQREMLKKFKVPEETISRMNRGSANDFLNDRFGKKR